MKDNTFISIVAYASNDETAVGSFLTQLDKFSDQRFRTHETIVVDDASTDATVKAAFAVKDAVKGNVTVIRLAGRHGRQRAIRAGTDLSIGDLIFEVDKIPSPLLEENLTRMLETASTQDTDIVLGSTMRLVTRRALYAMESSPGATRAERYMNCEFNWVTIPGESPVHKKNPVFFTGDNAFGNLLRGLAILFVAAGITLALLKLTVPGLMTAGFAVILWILNLIHKRAEDMKQDFGDYKVREITRINRY